MPDPRRRSSGQHDVAPFRVEVHRQGELVRVVPVGELDVATTSTLEARLRELRAGGFRRIVLDLRELTFLGSTGIHLIFSEHDLAGSEGRSFSLIKGAPAVQRVLSLCGLAEQLRFQSPRALDPSPAPALASPWPAADNPAVAVAFQAYLGELRHQAHRQSIRARPR